MKTKLKGTLYYKQKKINVVANIDIQNLIELFQKELYKYMNTKELFMIMDKSLKELESRTKEQ